MKKLSVLMPSLTHSEVEIHAVAFDSAKVSHGSLFVAVSGHAQDGINYIPEAIEKGAAAIVVEERHRHKITEIMGDKKIAVPVVWVENSRKSLSDIASRFYETQPSNIAMVTGTSGKSSVVWFTRQILEGLGFDAASLGTMGLYAGDFFKKGALTTADPVSLHKILSDLWNRNIDYLAVEASSHGIEQHRLDGAHVKVAAFTNLSQDHLDYHGDMESYFKAKQRLFTDCLDQNGVVILNADIPEFRTLNDISKHHSLKTIQYGIHATGDNAICLINRSILDQGQDLVLSIAGETLEFTLPLIGSFQVHNLLCAIGIAQGLLDVPIDSSALKVILSTLKTVPGRLEKIEGHPRKASVYVDYAHKPDALQSVLKAIAPHTQGKLWLVFGCGGDRDRGKRSKMAQIAFDLADEVIVTDDNPRNEDPADIRAEITAGFPSFKNIGDRRQAIDLAISSLQMGDSLIIAGKGHESGQIFHAQTLPFDDRDETRQSIHSLVANQQ